MGGSPPPKAFPTPTAYGAADSKAVTSIADPNNGNVAAGAYQAPPAPAPAPAPPVDTGITMEDLLGTDVARMGRRGKYDNPDLLDYSGRQAMYEQ